ncbi:MAG: ATP-dependent helicase [Anaerolineae bacterium]
MPFIPRPRQLEMVQDYLTHGGKMAISAVPGSGKTHTLSYLAAQLVANKITEEQEVLIVTLVNSAVDNFRLRIASFIKEMKLLPGMGYRVRTLHGLAHDIVRQRPALAGLSEDFVIVDESEAARILEDTVREWCQANPDFPERYLTREGISTKSLNKVLREKWPELMCEVARAFIKRAKDWRVTVGQLQNHLATVPTALPLAQMGTAIYAEYQRRLAARGGVDFDDLIRMAYHILTIDKEFLERLRRQWPYVLEDEAQDSSRSQEDILRLLADHPEGGWVRVGDPNQSIYYTFTNASPRYLREFMREPGVRCWELPHSGRSQPSIIHLANALIEWTQQEHPIIALRSELTPPFIEPSPPGDPQPNPPDAPERVRLISEAYTPEQELQAVVKSVRQWMAQSEAHPDATIAVLVPSNRRGAQVADALRRAGIKTVELLDNPPATRSAAEILGHVLRHLSKPTESRHLADIFADWHGGCTGEIAPPERTRAIASWLGRLRYTEGFLWPVDERAGEEGLSSEVESDARAMRLLVDFRDQVRRWQTATMLPIDQLVLMVAQDLFTEPADLALAHKLAVELHTHQMLNPNWRLNELAEELEAIARNERRFMGFSEAAYEPRPGEVTVATMHRAKGLEWDRVYLTSVNDYDFPSAQPEDTYTAERWFIRDRLNLQAEALEQLRVLCEGVPSEYVEGAATQQARLDYAAERLRLFYVGITRARKELIITWNTGRALDNAGGHQLKKQALPFAALMRRWQEKCEQRKSAAC